MAAFTLLIAYTFTGGYKEFALNAPSNSVTKDLSIPEVPIYNTKFVRQDHYGTFYKTVLRKSKKGAK